MPQYIYQSISCVQILRGTILAFYKLAAYPDASRSIIIHLGYGTGTGGIDLKTS